jgi:uncharacterized membrane protein YgcG
LKLTAHIYKCALALLALAGLCSATSPARAAERILSFDSTITVNRDGTLEVSEAIRVRAEGKNIRRGIYRDFPTTYPRAGGGQVVVGFDFQSATRDGRNEPWHTENMGNGVRVYVGSPSRNVPHGEHTYVLVYRTDRQMGYFADHDELYWNATGNGWGFTIDRASARLLLPDEIPRTDIRLEGYTGPFGSKGQDFSASLDNGAPLFVASRSLKPREGLTIVAMWPKGYIMPSVETAQPPAPAGSEQDRTRIVYEGSPEREYSSPAEALLRRDLPHDRRPVFFGLTGLALLIGYYYFVWNRVGRDPPARVIIPEYEMPPDLSVAAMRYLVRMKYDNECFAAAILSLAVKGYLRIEQSDGILGFGKTFTLVREPNPGKTQLSSDEQKLLGKLFGKNDRLELEQKNHRRVSSACTAHEGTLDAGYKRGFFSVNGGWHLLGIILSVLFILITLSQPGAADFWPQWYLTSALGWLTLVSAIGGLVVNGVFGKLLRAPTEIGQRAMEHIRGFKMYLEVAEGEDLKRISKPPPKLTPALYEAYLPAALALDVEQKWAERFARELEIDPQHYQPAWYSGSAWNAGNIAGFSSQLGSSLSSAISSSSQAPGSSSGSSSGGGGGGSSGGGGGGGGGGGW